VSGDEAELGPMLAAEVHKARQLAPVATVAQATIDGATAAALLAKEGAYSIACTLEYQLFDFLDFTEWLQGSLLPELVVVRLVPCLDVLYFGKVLRAHEQIGAWREAARLASGAAPVTSHWPMLCEDRFAGAP
jgi:hypothetical protein